MPKDPKHIVEAQKQRIKIKQRSSKYAPGRVTLQILGTGAKGAPRAVYLFSDQSRYLFNVGEGTQRLAHEHKTKLAKLEHIFITQAAWKNLGGLPGVALTIQDVGVPQITLHGPAGLNEIFTATRRFVVLRDLQIKMAECGKDITFEDSVLIVKYVHLDRREIIPLFSDQDVQVSVEQAEATTSTRIPRKRNRKRSQGKEMIEDDTDYYAHERKPRRNKRSRSRSQNPESGMRTAPEKSTYLQSLIDSKEHAYAVCYICRLQPRPGALNLNKCVEKGVPPGPLLGKLKNGEDITLPNGTVVVSSEVCEPDDPGPIFIVVDCPTKEYLESFLEKQEWRKHQRFAQSDEDCACLVVHFTPKEVMDLPEYKKWMDEFSPSTDHIPVNESNSCMGSVAVHRIQHKLNLLSSDIFPHLGDGGTPAIEENQQKKKQKLDLTDLDQLNLDQTNGKSKSVHRHIGSLTSYCLRPRKGFDSTSHVTLDTDEYVNETMIQKFPEVLKRLHENIQSSKQNLIIKDYPKILFLGTGSCIPNKTRNTSGILLQTSETQNILLDCGEGTCGQILRFFGPVKGDEVLSNLDAIYVSHLHADHHIGLIGLLQGRRQALERLKLDKDPVIVFAPKQILAWLNFYHRFFENIDDEYFLVPNSEMLFDQPTPNDKTFLKKLQLKNFTTCFVKHCPNAFGVAIEHKSGYKITYSGDTMPSDNLIKIGENSDILIHEATMEDDLAKEAIYKMHSTTSQAIQVGKDMKAKNVILTHFSQRYAKLPRFNDNFADNVSIAFDNMLVKLDELPLIPLFYPALKIMFADHYEELENKAVKRQLKSERQQMAERNEIEKIQ